MSKNLLTKGASVVALLVVFVAFQNCGKQMKFSSNELEKSLNDPQIVEVPLDDNSNDIVDDDTNNDPSDDTDPPEVVDNDDPSNDDVTDNDDPSDNSSDDPADDVSNDDPANNDVVDDNDDDNPGENDDEDNGEKLFICIINGPGKSLKLAYVDNQLIAQNSAAKTVCTTERACLEVASEKFDVKSAEKRGFCKQENEHSIHLSGSELEAILSSAD